MKSGSTGQNLLPEAARFSAERGSGKGGGAALCMDEGLTFKPVDNTPSGGDETMECCS